LRAPPGRISNFGIFLDQFASTVHLPAGLSKFSPCAQGQAARRSGCFFRMFGFSGHSAKNHQGQFACEFGAELETYSR
jgi:hypothetical protein